MESFDQGGDDPRLPTLVDGQVRPFEHEPRMHELEHHDIVPSLLAQPHVTAADMRVRVDDDRGLQPVDPPSGESGDRPIRLQSPVVGNAEQSFDEIPVDPLHRIPERLL